MEGYMKGRDLETDELLRRSLDFEDPTVYTDLGRALLAPAVCDVEGAIEILEKGSRKHPTDFEILYALGDAYEKAGRMDDACEAWYKGAEQEPDTPETIAIVERLRARIEEHRASQGTE